LQMIDRPAKPNWRQPKFWAPFVVVGEPQRK
jgi:CHAT domain-containing protein